jgi:peptide/nickel transport system ATP-binding protein
MSSQPVLSVSGLSVEYQSQRGSVRVLDGITFSLERGKILGIVGESGSGKSTLGLSTIGLLPQNARIAGGEVNFRGKTILTPTKSDFETVRGTGIAMIFQEPLNSLNPVYRVGFQIAEAIRVRELEEGPASWAVHDYAKEEKAARPKLLSNPLTRVKMTPEIKKEIREYLTAVRIQDPASVVDKYPHELSGGMRQRVMIAMALAERPSVLIADEPTTALDVTTQAKVLSLIRDLTREFETAVVLISHDLSVVSEVADTVQVMYLGEAVEAAPSKTIFGTPLHPYTVGLLGSIPTTYVDQGELSPISGTIPDPSAPPSGCRFHTRCPKAFARCPVESPAPVTIGESTVRCHLYTEGERHA